MKEEKLPIELQASFEMGLLRASCAMELQAVWPGRSVSKRKTTAKQQSIASAGLIMRTRYPPISEEGGYRKEGERQNRLATLPAFA